MHSSFFLNTLALRDEMLFYNLKSDIYHLTIHFDKTMFSYCSLTLICLRLDI